MDLIDREELLDALYDRLCHPKTPEQSSGIAAAEKLVKKQPAIQPKRGEWEGYVHSAFYGIDDFGDPIYRDKIVWYCSNPKCRRKTVIKENYCPNCGADMRGKEDD